MAGAVATAGLTITGADGAGDIVIGAGAGVGAAATALAADATVGALDDQTSAGSAKAVPTEAVTKSAVTEKRRCVVFIVFLHVYLIMG